MTRKRSHEGFVKKAIIGLRKGSFRGIHTAHSGFNEAFKKYVESDEDLKDMGLT